MGSIQFFKSLAKKKYLISISGFVFTVEGYRRSLKEKMKNDENEDDIINYNDELDNFFLLYFNKSKFVSVIDLTTKDV